MFLRAKLTNFRQHTAREFFFHEGMTAIRGPNEKGKSTLIEAMLYALFGVTALRESLVDVVTWGCKPSTLRVEIDKVVDGVTYTFIRSQSGAEVRVGPKVLATGQTEVKKFAEELLRCGADTASSLMLATQKDLRGALDAKPGEAVKLIDKLANFQLLDRIIELVQKHLTAGATTSVEARIESLEAQLGAAVPDDLERLQQQQVSAKLLLSGAREALEPVMAAHLQSAGAAQEAAQVVQEHARREAAHRTATAAVTTCQNSLQGILIPEAVSEETIKAFQAQIAEADTYASTVALWQQFQQLGTDHDEWEGDDASLAEAVRAASKEVQTLAETLSRLDVQHASTTAQLITDSVCKLCSKDLADVPEVVQQNLRLSTALQALEASQKAVRQQHADRKAELDQMTAVQAHERVRGSRYRALGDKVTLDTGFVPCRVTWAGPAVPSQAPSKPSAELARALATNQTRQQALGRQQQAQATLQGAQQALARAEQALAEQTVKLPAAQDLLQHHAEQVLAVQEKETIVRQAERQLDEAKAALASELRVVETRRAHREVTETLLKEAKIELTDMRENNELLKVLRNAKPEIATELWAIVAASVSTYFTDIRGETSVFSKTADGFFINGRGIEGLSGSALDSLGLAVRLALTRTFLPNTDFLVVDEPAAAADDNRERNMLGVLATCGMRQVLCVTHSDAAEAFAQQTLYV